jgi:hypothetical protein
VFEKGYRQYFDRCPQCGAEVAWCYPLPRTEGDPGDPVSLQIRWGRERRYTLEPCGHTISGTQIEFTARANPMVRFHHT